MDQSKLHPLAHKIRTRFVRGFAVLGLLFASMAAMAQAQTPVAADNLIFLCPGDHSGPDMQDAGACESGGRIAWESFSPLISLSFSVSQPAGSAGVSAGKPVVGPLVIKKFFDRNSATLAQAAFTFEAKLPSETLAIGVNTPGPNGSGLNLTIVLDTPVVLSDSLSLLPGSNSEMVETTSFSFKTMTIYDHSTNPATITTLSMQ